jgi:hypothetical protein
MKKAIAIILALSLATAVFWAANTPTPVYAEEYRSGFLLTPVSFDATGIYTDTDFILKTQNDYTVDQIKEMLSLDGGNPIQVTENKQNEFLIAPENEFEPNSLCRFVLTTPENEPISWTFQTRRGFTVLGTLPAHQSSYVPVNSGIEIYFSHTGFANPEKYFEISPTVEGRFETSGYTAVFIPKKLEPATIYTVTVKKGLPLNGTDQKLAEDYVFAFETEPEQTPGTIAKGTLYYTDILMEYPTNEAPLIPLYIYSATNSEKAVVSTKIYKYKNSGDFIEAMKLKFEQPYWAYSINQKKILTSESLEEVSSFEQTFDLRQWQDRYLSVPEPLPQGFYLVESTYDGLTAQMLIQSTDLSAYVTESQTQTIVWVNSIKSGKPVVGAEVAVSAEEKTYKTDPDGIAAFDTIIKEEDNADDYELQYYHIKNNNEELILALNRYEIYRYIEHAQENYWRYFQTDRNLYKTDDLVQFWGFLKNRYDGTSPEKVTVEIAEGGYWGIPRASFLGYFLPFIEKPLISMNISADNGFFEGSFFLPKLSPGGYRISVKVDNEIINSHYINVENYVKPAYKMTVEKDKNAVFIGETVNFTITPAFFDGTPLPSLDVTYNVGGHPFGDIYETAKTGADGKLSIPFTVTTDDDKAQGERSIWLNANASLPESGMISGNEYVRVFINDIHAAFQSYSEKPGEINLKAALNEIVLDRLNNPEADEPDNYSDYIGDPVKHKTIDGTIYYHYYEKIEDGEEYDYINKVVRKRYRYEEHKEKVNNFSFTTGEDGIATEAFTLEHPNKGWYTAELEWEDNSGRTMTRNVYLSNRIRIEIDEEKYDWYHLESDKDKYRVDDEVIVTLKNHEEPVTDARILFVEAQKGIKKYTVQNDPEYKTKFTEKIIPNFHVGAVFFNGKNYFSAGTRNIRYDTDEMKIDLSVEADSESYRPGDTVNLKITAKDEKGNPVAARVNLAIIDEAMLQISHYSVDVLNSLYQWLGSGIGYSGSSHNTGFSGIDGIYSKADEMAVGGMAPEPTRTQSQVKMDMGENEVMLDGAGFGNIEVRTEFKDTALFRVTALAEDGTGTVSFRLPDNVTSWHVFAAGISSDLYGGTGESDLKVTLPFFINDSINSTYLSGDFPYIGVTGYGNSLKEGEKISWQVTSPQVPNYVGTASGNAFERVNIPLWKLEEGIYDLEIKAITESGLSDGIRRTIYVTDTYHEIEEAVTEILKPNMQLAGGKDGLTTLIFTDRGRGRFIPVLYGLMHGGSRLDQKYTAYWANQLLDEIAPDRKSGKTIEVDLSQYQKSDGGYGILPYSESDPELSALLTPLLKNESGAQRLKQYFYTLIFNEPGRVNAPALYGLAEMAEPVLVDLNNVLDVQNLSLKDYMYLALAYEALGESHTAEKIYNERVAPVLEDKSPYIRVKNSDDTDEILKDTALAAVLASRLDIPDKEGLFEYAARNYSRKVLINAEKLMYVIEEYKKLSNTDVEFTYKYDGNTYTEKISGGGSVSVSVPSVKLSEFKITKVSGEACVVSVYNAPLVNLAEQDQNLKIKRTYYNYSTGNETTEFKQDDIVKVVLEWDASPVAIDKYYEITDFAPSGLKPIESPYQIAARPDKELIWWFRNVDGQKVTFNIYRDAKNRDALVYYARVVSPGTFTADGTIIQGTIVKDSMLIGESTIIKISE